MTALIKDQIPNQIDSMEELAAWVTLWLSKVNPTRAITEALGENPQRVAESFILTADDGTQRLISRVSLELNPNWVSDTSNPIWLHAKEFENIDLTSDFTNG